MKRIIIFSLSALLVSSAVFAVPRCQTERNAYRTLSNKAQRQLRVAAKQYQLCMRKSRGNRVAFNQCKATYSAQKAKIKAVQAEAAKAKAIYKKCVAGGSSPTTTTTTTSKTVPCKALSAKMNAFHNQYTAMKCTGLSASARSACMRKRSALRSQYYHARKEFYSCLRRNR